MCEADDERGGQGDDHGGGDTGGRTDQPTVAGASPAAGRGRPAAVHVTPRSPRRQRSERPRPVWPIGGIDLVHPVACHAPFTSPSTPPATPPATRPAGRPADGPAASPAPGPEACSPPAAMHPEGRSRRPSRWLLACIAVAEEQGQSRARVSPRRTAASRFAARRAPCLRLPADVCRCLRMSADAWRRCGARGLRGRAGTPDRRTSPP